MGIAVPAKDLVQELTERLRSEGELGFMSCTVYDTAWISCIEKVWEDGRVEWLFPKSFEYVLDQQLPSGGWPSHGSAEGDALNSLAGIFTFCRHLQAGNVLRYHNPEDLSERISRATQAVEDNLKLCDCDQAQNVGFEILAPALLTMIEAHGLTISFPGRSRLENLRSIKLSKMKPSYLYSTKPTSILHSVEAFYNDKDFDFNRIRHHCCNGSLMGSPSATAAYLMSIDSWDDRAEAYLSSVVSSGAGCGNGAVPSAFPSTHFEIIWTVSTLLQCGYGTEDLNAENIAYLADAIEEAYKKGNGLVGFAAFFEDDLDDTARARVQLVHARRNVSSLPMIEKYGHHDHFVTYIGERNPSISANCNALMAMLYDPTKCSTCRDWIKTQTTYILKRWLSSDHLGPEDKWNMSVLYSTMLIAQTFAQLLILIDEQEIKGLEHSIVAEVNLSVLQIMIQLLHGQNSNGSWGQLNTKEETAYAVIALCSIARLPTLRYFQPTLIFVLAKACEFLATMDTSKQRRGRLWIEKVNYESRVISQAYQLSALKMVSLMDHVPVFSNGSISDANFRIFHDEISQYSLIAEKSKGTGGLPRWLLVASLLEAEFYVARLKISAEILLDHGHEDGDAPLKLLAFFVCTINNKVGRVLRSDLIEALLLLSMFCIQADQPLRGLVQAECGSKSLEAVYWSIKQMVHEVYEDNHSPAKQDIPTELQRVDKKDSVSIGCIRTEIQPSDVLSKTSMRRKSPSRKRPNLCHLTAGTGNTCETKIYLTRLRLYVEFVLADASMGCKDSCENEQMRDTCLDFFRHRISTIARETDFIPTRTSLHLHELPRPVSLHSPHFGFQSYTPLTLQPTNWTFSDDAINLLLYHLLNMTKDTSHRAQCSSSPIALSCMVKHLTQHLAAMCSLESQARLDCWANLQTDEVRTVQGSDWNQISERTRSTFPNVANLDSDTTSIQHNEDSFCASTVLGYERRALKFHIDNLANHSSTDRKEQDKVQGFLHVFVEFIETVASARRGPDRV